jgi:hypothetical protein
MFLPCRPCCTPRICNISGCSIPDELTLEITLGSILYDDGFSAGEKSEIESISAGTFIVPFDRFDSTYPGYCVYILDYDLATSFSAYDTKMRASCLWWCSENLPDSVLQAGHFYDSTQQPVSQRAEVPSITLGFYSSPFSVAGFGIGPYSGSSQYISSYCSSPATLYWDRWNDVTDTEYTTAVRFIEPPADGTREIYYDATVTVSG